MIVSGQGGFGGGVIIRGVRWGVGVNFKVIVGGIIIFVIRTGVIILIICVTIIGGSITILRGDVIP